MVICVKKKVEEVYIFNPANDLALATGGINYVAPPFAVRMAADLAVLPAFIAKSGSLVITDSDDDAHWLEHLNELFGLDVHAVKRSELRSLDDCCIRPWGWCLDLRRRLVKWGVNRECLPTKDEIYHLRGLSHRRISVLMHLRLQELLGKGHTPQSVRYASILEGGLGTSNTVKNLCPAPVELAVTDEVVEFVRRHRDCYIKTPWSSSGRGIYHTTGGVTPELEQWCKGALKRQGSVLCELALDKVMDFALEFVAENGCVQMRGLSIFFTDSHSQYRHGLVAQEAMLKSRITELYPNIDEVVAAVTQALNEMVAPHYSGWLGVDMLLYNNVKSRKHNAQSGTGNSISVNPCVELNLRPTMGAVTAMLGERLLAPGKTAIFAIEQRSSYSEPWQTECDAVVKDGRLCSGTLCLTTPSDTAHYRAVLTVEGD